MVKKEQIVFREVCSCGNDTFKIFYDVMWKDPTESMVFECTKCGQGYYVELDIRVNIEPIDMVEMTKIGIEEYKTPDKPGAWLLKEDGTWEDLGLDTNADIEKDKRDGDSQDVPKSI